jgi:non-specific serine/threonine protein kinase
MIGRTVLHYRVEERLGVGGMGEVYRARDLRLDRDVALKFLPASRQADPESRARLLGEARAAAALRSPHVAAIFEIEEYEGALFIVMEYVRGEPLSRRTARGPVPPLEGIAIAIQVATALEEAHGRGLVHRDIKSSNIMIDDRGVAKVLDFGLAKYRPDVTLTTSHAPAPVTAADVVLGTLAYMSPEQARNLPVDGRSDLFSLGVVLHEMLAGQLPFDTSSAADLLEGILHGSPAPVPVGSPDLERVLARALAKDPAGRYQSAAEFRAALEDARRGLTMTGEGPSQSGTSSAGATLTHGGGSDGRSGHRVAVLRFANITGQPADDWIGAGLAETVTSDLKHLHAVTVIGTEQVADTLQRLNRDDTRPDKAERDLAIRLGRQLGATCIVTGGYQRQGHALRITARFVDVPTGTVTKTVRLDGDMTQIFALQDQIVHELTHDLDLRLHASEMLAIEEPETRSIQAYEYYSRGLVELRRAEQSSLERAIELFESALEHDPRYASGWAALGAAYDLKAFFSGMPQLSERAVELERRALAINPRLSVAHHWLGVAYLNTGRFDEAIAASGEAIRLDPGNALAHAARGRGLAFGRGRLDDAIKELTEAVRLDATLGYAHLLLARLYLLRGEYTRAEASARQAVQVQETGSSLRGPNVAGARLVLGLVYYWQGRYEDALHEYEHERAGVLSTSHAERNRILLELEERFAAVFWRLGRGEESDRHFQQALDAFAREGESHAPGALDRYGLAALLALRGDAGRALAYLSEAAAALPAFIALLLERDPDCERLRDDARVRAKVS